jgi:CoA-transferase family III
LNGPDLHAEQTALAGCGSRPLFASPHLTSAERDGIGIGARSGEIGVMHKPLDGLLVVSLEQAVAAPYCSSRLADAGARVIKIERAEGDFARGYDTAAHGLSSYFVWLNRGKQSLVLVPVRIRRILPTNCGSRQPRWPIMAGPPTL